MKILISFLFFINIVYAHHIEKINIALYGLDKKVANEKTVKKLFQKLIEKIDELKDLELNTFFYKNESDLIRDYESNKNHFDLLYIVPSTYLKNYKVFNQHSKSSITIKQSDDKYVQYYIITNKKSNIKKLENIRNRKLDLHSSDELSRIWFDKICYERFGKSFKPHILKESRSFNQYKKILDVFFNKTDMAIVTKEMWDTTVSLNPTIEKNLRIIEKSPSIFPAVIGLVHKSADNEIFDAYDDYIMNNNNEEYIEDVLSLVKFRKIETLKEKDFQKAYEFYSNYLEVKEKYK